MNTGENYIEVDFFQKKKADRVVCGDSFMSKKLKEEGRIICVMSDGLGSGIKANILSTMTASMALNFSVMNDDIITASTTIIKTLPTDNVKGISYSTFCICEIDYFDNVRIIEYETPSFCLYRKGAFVSIYKEKVPIDRDDMRETFLWISEFTLRKEDRIIFYSDGVYQSGTGSDAMPLGWGDGVKEYISRLIARSPTISAADLSRRIVVEAEKNDGYSAKDDISCSVIYMREPRNLLIATGPPYDRQNDKYLAKQIDEFQGEKIICGGTTAQIVARELERELLNEKQHDPSLPPMSKMEGIDLITEGIITVSKIERILTTGDEENEKDDGLAELVIKYLMDSDRINFLVGTVINSAHHDPNLPVELEVRKNVMKKIKYILETKYLKDVEIKYI